MREIRKIFYAKIGIQYARAFSTFLVITCGAPVLAFPLVGNEDEVSMISDLTIYLDEPLLSEGGTVIVIPQEVGQKIWQDREGYDNPALNDQHLDRVRSIGDNDRRLGVVISAKVNVVRFNFPEDGKFNFAFAPLNRETAPTTAGRTKLLRNGEGTDTDPVSQKDVKVASIMVVHVIGSKSSEADTLEADNRIKFVGLEHYYKCTRYEQAIACDATEQVK